MRRNPNAEPKPFVLVDIPSQPPERRSVTTHEKFTGLTGRLELLFEVVSEYLFVGSGEFEFDLHHRNQRPDVWYTFFRRNGQICVPGTSVKGAVRAIVEAISNSCVSQYRRSKEKLASRSHEPCRWKARAEVKDNRLCPACRLFGTTGYRGRAYFTDFLPDKDVQTEVVKIGELWEPQRYDPSRRRFYERKIFHPIRPANPERNFRFVEAVRKGSTFRGALVFENVGEAELGLLLYALGWEYEKNEKGKRWKIAFSPKLGGAKPRCFGSVEFYPEELRLWNDSLAGLLNPQTQQKDDLPPFLCRWMEACENQKLLDTVAWDRLKDGFKPRQERCPREVYR